ncbi:MAG: class I SAM-dependent methyltransferase [Micavibrio sp.]
MNQLEEKIRHAINLNGPMSIETYMNLAVGQYYASRDPFGAEGDFITAPEISQMFGELIGIWIADTWIKLGQPETFNLIEAGPGRGTLMADILRATERIPGFHDAAQIHLIENSTALREMQEHNLQGYQVWWHETLDSVPSGPIIFIANEFFDALPIRQFICKDGQWHERVVALENDKLVLGLSPAEVKLPVIEGAVKEMSPQSMMFVNKLANLIEEQTGAALIIDYGYDQTYVGDTLQAVKDHKPAEILENPGDSDLTALVDFLALKTYAANMAVKGPITQGAFLKNMGIDLRLEKLKAIATPQQIMDLQTGYVRLTAPDQMGDLFKVMGFCHDPKIQLGGF